ncbi:MAG: hypothetical protein KDA61_21130 [Planctomycetales bacterium]|nr:hypothetical protein [Planctomycetales bacterium]
MKTTAFSLLFLVALGVSTPAQAARYLVDFGRNDVATGGGQGAVTPSPDANGNYWNNFNKEDYNSNTGSLDVPDDALLSNLVDISNGASAIGIQLVDSTGNNEWEANGAINGGLLSPDSALLGEFAIETATRDYFFTTQPSASFLLTGLNPAATYDLEFFATRDTTGSRTTQYRATDANGMLLSDPLDTSGVGVGSAAHPNGNDDDTVTILGLVPNGNNEIAVDMLTVAGGFSYVGIMQITETVVPEPCSVALSVFGLALAGAMRRRS